MNAIWEFLAGKYRDAEGGFSPREAWGDPQKINGLLLLAIYALRLILQIAIVIHCAVETSGHAQKGQHPEGNAVDFHLVSSTLPFYEQILMVEKALKGLQIWDRIGIGIYPAWNTPGFHLDVRGKHAEWGWIGSVDEKGNKIYVSYKTAKEYARKI
jgi:hypothetical protein